MNLIEKAHFLHRAWRYRRRTEKQEIAFLMSRNLSGATVLDIGANRGIYSYWMHKKVGPTGHIIAFEPQPELVDFLHDLKKTFHINQLHIANTGLSSTSGPSTLIRPQNHWGGASLERDPGSEPTDRLAIEATTLDDHFQEHESLRPVRFIKCDIEGHEYDCFLGGKNMLREDHPDLLFECGNKKIDRIKEYLTGLGYDGYFFLHGRLTPIAKWSQLRSTIDKPFLNYVFMKSS